MKMNPLLQGIAKHLEGRGVVGQIDRALAYKDVKSKKIVGGTTHDELVTLAQAYLDGERLDKELAELAEYFENEQEGGAGHQTDHERYSASPTACERLEPTHPAKKTIIQRSPAGEIRYESHACYTGNHDVEALASEALASEALSIEELDQYAVWTADEGYEAGQNRLQQAIAKSLLK